jgi:hypothetical protein
VTVSISSVPYGSGPNKAVVYSDNNPHRDERGIRLRPNSDNKNLSECESGASSGGDVPVLSGTEVRGASPVHVNKYSVDAEIAVGSIIVQTIWAWIEGLRMRLKIKRDLGRKATRADLTSIDTWIKVDEVEQRKDLDKPTGID